MWQDDILERHIATSSSLQAQSIVHLEWNLNDPEYIDRVGNYRQRFDSLSLNPIYDPTDSSYSYTNATFSDTEIVPALADIDAENIPVEFIPNGYSKMFFSLDDCFSKMRPRSGINKFVYLAGRKIPYNAYDERSPRYYVANRKDNFKYWSSYRQEKNQQYGISDADGYISDACPFVVYTKDFMVNYLTIKIQTHADADASPGTYFNRKEIPEEIEVQFLYGNAWERALSITSEDIDYHGTIDLKYGLLNKGYYVGNEPTDLAFTGDIYVNLSDNTVHRYDGTSWDNDIEQVAYGWQILTEEYNQFPSYDDVYRASYDDSYLYHVDGEKDNNRHFDIIRGIRLVVRKMTGPGQTFDLIEISPRVRVDISQVVKGFSIDRSLANPSETSLPVGQLLAGTGSLNIFDNHSLFASQDNAIGQAIDIDMKAIFFEGIGNVKDDDTVTRRFVRLGTMYSEAKRPMLNDRPNVEYELRDGFWLFENKQCPNLLIRQASLSVAIATILDTIGFSNYAFVRGLEDSDPIIPFFFVNSEFSIAQALQELARATQSAMFFDEYNSFIVMFKNRMMPSNPTADIKMIGNSGDELANIKSFASEDKQRFNDGSISFSEKSLGREIYNFDDANRLAKGRRLYNKPSLLWEVQPQNSLYSTGEQSSGYSLFAGPLKKSLTREPVKVVGGQLTNNVIEIGDQIDLLADYEGYLYANGEIIRFDAVEYVADSISRNSQSGVRPVTQQISKKWITSASEYEEMRANVPFGGTVYPTGRLRIFAEPRFNEDGTYKNGDVQRSGRGYFNTEVVHHYGIDGINRAWTTDSKYVKAYNQSYEHLFKEYGSDDDNPSLNPSGNPWTMSFTSASPGANNTVAKAKIKREHSVYMPGRAFGDYTSTSVSALVVTGGSTDRGTVSIVNHPLLANATSNSYRIGTRARIVGQKKDVFSDSGLRIDRAIQGGSGGLIVMSNPTNSQYIMLEIASVDLFEDVETPDENRKAFFNVALYQTGNVTEPGSPHANKQYCDLLWRGNYPIASTEIMYEVLSARTTDQFSYVADLAANVKRVGNGVTIDIFINDQALASVTVDGIDSSITNVNKHCGVFVRGNTKMMFEHFYRYSDVTEQSTNSLLKDYQLTQPSFTKYKVPLSSAKQLDALYTRMNSMYYEEFGTIMRQCEYFNIKYDQSFPAFTAKIMPTFNRLPVYFTHSFMPHAYGAELMVFNAADHAVNLNDEYGSFLRINGIAVSTGSQREYSVDDYFSEFANTSRPLSDSLTGTNIVENVDTRVDILKDRIRRGKSEFNFSSVFIQSQDAARKLMQWLIDKALKEHILVGLDIFPNPMIQLGDIFTINAVDSNDKEYVEDKSFVVYNIKYERSPEGLKQTVYGVDI